MNGDGRKGPDPMTDQRSEGDVGPILHTWMAAVAPQRAPERLLEEAFARTMVSGQHRVYPWHGIRRDRAARSTQRRFAGIALGMAAVLAIAVTVGLVFRPGPGVGDGPSPTPSSSPAASSSAFPSPVVVTSTGSVPVTNGAQMATDGTAIWLLKTDGTLVRIDPLTNTIAASVTLTQTPGGFGYQSLAGDAAGLWVTDWDATSVLRFDPLTLDAITTIDIGAAPKGVLVTSTAVWVASTRGGAVERIDPATNTIVGPTIVGPTGPSGPNWLTRGFGSIWVGVPNRGSVFRINETTNAIEATIPILSPATPCGGLATTSTAIWVASCEGSHLVAQIDPTTNTVVAYIDVGGDSFVFAVVADRPWISPTEGQIVRVDPVSHAVDRVIAPGPEFASGGGDIVVAAGSLWIVDFAANRVLRLPIDAFEG